MRYIVLPQAWRVILPPAFAFFVLFIKDTALASQIGVIELTYAGKVLNNKGFSAALVFGTILVLYFLDLLSAGAAWSALEARLAPSRHSRPEARYGAVACRSTASTSLSRRATIIGLIGPSGSGKSTILRALVGLDPSRAAGTVRLDGEIIDYAQARATCVACATASPSCSSNTISSKT